jgi:hypothetical protein
MSNELLEVKVPIGVLEGFADLPFRQTTCEVGIEDAKSVCNSVERDVLLFHGVISRLLNHFIKTVDKIGEVGSKVRVVNKELGRVLKEARKYKRSANYYKGITKQCENCQKTITKPANVSDKNFSLRRFCSRDCSHKFFVGPRSPVWKGGRVFDKTLGRQLVYVGHGKGSCGHKNSYEYEYRQLAGAEGSQEVHHIDGNPNNNDPTNLSAPMSKSEHTRLHHELRGHKVSQATK